MKSSHNHAFLTLSDSTRSAGYDSLLAPRSAAPVDPMKVTASLENRFMNSPTAAQKFADVLEAERVKAGSKFWSAPESAISIARSEANKVYDDPFVTTAELLKSSRSYNYGNYVSAKLESVYGPETTSLILKAVGKPPEPAPSEIITAMKDPIVIATVYLLATTAAVPADVRRDLILHMLTLARRESTFNSGAEAPAPSTAKGLLQQINTTYDDSLAIANRSTVRFPSHARTVVNEYLSALNKSPEVLRTRRPYLVRNREDGRRDKTQPVANLGIMLKHLASVDADWDFIPNQGWKPRIATPNVRLVTTRYPQLLRDERVGRQFLITIYHVNGNGYFRLKNVLPLAHEKDAIIPDVKYFSMLAAVPGLPETLIRMALDQLKVYTSPLGDPLTTAEDLSLDKYNAHIGARFHLARPHEPSFRQVTPVSQSRLDSMVAYTMAKQPVFSPWYGTIERVKSWNKKVPNAIVSIRSSEGDLIEISGLGRVFVTAGTAVQPGMIIASTPVKTGPLKRLQIMYKRRGVGYVTAPPSVLNIINP